MSSGLGQFEFSGLDKLEPTHINEPVIFDNEPVIFDKCSVLLSGASYNECPV